MPAIPVHIPSLLVQVAGVTSPLSGQGETVRAVLADVFDRVPTLRVHVFDESERLRPHVLCFLNDTNTRWLDSLDEPVKAGDELTILQAVSGG